MSSDNDAVNGFLAFIGFVLCIVGVIVSLVTGGVGSIFGIPMTLLGVGLIKGAGKG